LIRRGRSFETTLVRLLILLSAKKSAGVGVSGIVVRGESADSPLVFVPDEPPVPSSSVGLADTGS